MRAARVYRSCCADHGARLGRSPTRRLYGDRRKAKAGKFPGLVDESATGPANLWSGGADRRGRARRREEPLGRRWIAQAGADADYLAATPECLYEGGPGVIHDGAGLVNRRLGAAAGWAPVRVDGGCAAGVLPVIHSATRGRAGVSCGGSRVWGAAKTLVARLNQAGLQAARAQRLRKPSDERGCARPLAPIY
jgi:hypothetical protein